LQSFARDLKKTSRLVLYYLTGAQNEAERNTAGKYARIVDYLHREGIGDADAAEHIKSAGGIDEILKKARGREALKAADGTRQDDDRDFEELDETCSRASASDDLFDREKDLSIRVARETLERVLGQK
jgi:hypothetical protein